MAQGTLWLAPINRIFQGGTNTVPGAKAFFYLAGTTTPVSVYADVGLMTPITQPVVADSNGVFVEIFLTPGTAYKVDLQTSAGVSLAGYPADNQLAIPSSSSVTAQPGTAGETITAGQAVYLSDGSGGKIAGQWYKADSANAYSSTLPLVGMAPSAIAASATGTIITGGEVTGVTLTTGTDYYVGTAGALTSSAPANKRWVGRSDSTSSIIINANFPLFTQLPTLISGGVLAATGTTQLASSGVLAANAIMLGGGAGVVPSTQSNLTYDGTTITLGAGQIKFPTVQNASANAWTLDDYVEGAWTPVIAGAGGTSGQTYTNQEGRYIKIGSQVWASCNVIMSAKGTITGNVQINGLPFTAETGTLQLYTGSVLWVATATSFVGVYGYVAQNTTTALLFGITAAATSATGTALTTTDLGNTSGFRCLFVYRSAN